MNDRQQRRGGMPRCLVDSVAALDRAIDDKESKVALIEREYPDEKLREKDYQSRKRRLAAVDRIFEKAWIASLKHLDELCKKVRRCQPHLDELGADSINTGWKYPDSLVFGRVRLSYRNWRGYVPRLVRFPIRNALWCPEKDIDRRLIHQLLLRLMHSLPVGAIEIRAADPLRLGKSLHPFLSVLNVKRLFPDRRVLTRSDELEKSLCDLTDYVEDLLQNKFRGHTKDWSAFNAANRDNPLPCKLLVVFGIPEQLSDKSIWYLGRLLEHGPMCGVLPVLTVDEDRMADRKFDGLRAMLAEHSIRMDAMVPCEFPAGLPAHIQVSEEPEFWPPSSDLSHFLELISEKYEQMSELKKSILDLWSKGLWEKSSERGIVAPIGWTVAGEEIAFSVGGVSTEHHGLLAGRSGSGKSNLLHVLIHSFCHFYAPSELNIYLLDYKQATEFSAYASPPLPQARLVATESDPEYGVTVLAHLSEELEKRARIFKKTGVRDFSEYRESTSCELPRILLIIDEFQILFSEGRQVAERAEKKLNELLRQGRAYGMHVLLATQTLKGIQSLSMGQLISQIGCRVALACGEEDSAMILGASNWEAAKLSSPPEGIINNANGAKSANQRFLAPLADRELCKVHIQEIFQAANRQGLFCDTRIFNGSHLPPMPDIGWFESKRSDQIQLQLGERLSFEAQPLEIHLRNRASSNLLLSGYDDAIHDGLLTSVLQSLRFSTAVEEIVYFDARSVGAAGAGIFPAGIDKKLVCARDNVSDLDLARIAEDMSQVKRVLIIDGLDSAKSFHSGPATFRPVKKDAPASPSESLKIILEDGPGSGSFVIAFVDNWHRCNTSCKDLLSFFELRVGFCMNEDDAGSLVRGAIGKFKGLETDNRAVFADRLKNRVVCFRPYVNGESL